MKARVSHISLNAGGGAERLSMCVIRALSEMGIGIELRTFERPNPNVMNEAYSETLQKRISKVVTLGLLPGLFTPVGRSEADLHINTHGDMLPMFCNGYSKNNTITYCHYPIAGFLIDSEDKDYLDLLLSITSSHIPSEKMESFLEKAKDSYRQMMFNSTVLTNSEFSRSAIFKVFGVNSTVVYPPVDTERFRKAAFTHDDSRANDILVVSRFHFSKKIENAIHLASLLKQRHVGRRMVIVGNIPPEGTSYYSFLQRLVKDYELDDFVKFEPSVGLSRVIELMRASKVYFHPLPGEPFGISTVEAMGAGMIPVVPDIGGHTEFVPPQFQYHSFGQAIDAVVAALNATASDHFWMSHRAEAFCAPNFVNRFKSIVTELLEQGKLTANSRPLVASQRIPPHSLA